MNRSRGVEEVSFVFNMAAFEGAREDVAAFFIFGIEIFGVRSEDALHVDRGNHFFVIMYQNFEAIWEKGEREEGEVAFF